MQTVQCNAINFSVLMYPIALWVLHIMEIFQIFVCLNCIRLKFFV